MLRFLRIRNLAVIEAVEVEFDGGFTALTGETGAGKSILVEAVGLLLGARASAELVRTGETVATIEAIFDSPTPGAGHPTGELLIRREITSQGRSRSFINGTLATAGALRELAEQLVELHGQHEHQALLDPGTHLPLLDAQAGLTPLVDRVALAWSAVGDAREQLERSRMDAREKAARLDLLAFQLGEIERASPKPGEDEELATTKQVLASAERVQRLCEEGYAQLYDSDTAALATLGNVWKRVGELATIDAQFAPYLDVRDSIKSQLDDLALFLRRYADGVDASPARLQQVEDRLALLERLKRKYGPTLQDVIDTGDRLARERAMLTGAGQHTDELQRQLASASDAYLMHARELSAARRAAATRFIGRVAAVLSELAMARCQLEMRFRPDEPGPESWSERGIDQAELFLSPNPGEDPRPLARIVSGGELSRVMLALKSVAAADSPGKTLVFDEVDAGIGGRVADVVGARLQELGRQFQVLCITHLPQIAARATTQFRIDKAVRGERTVTSVERLDSASRVGEVARMISGSAVSPAVLASAQELILNAQTAPSAPAGTSPRGGAKGKRGAKGESESRRRA